MFSWESRWRWRRIGAWLAVKGGFRSLPMHESAAAGAYGRGGGVLADRFRHHLRLQDYEFDRQQRLHSLVVRGDQKTH